MKKIYFPNLNGLRFIAALLVIIHHTENWKSAFNLNNYAKVPSVHILGKLGVILFFVLSGFLITYLLLNEKKETKDISVKDFYLRRVLRIWPLYYLIVILVLFVFPQFNFFKLEFNTTQIDFFKSFLFLAGAPNLALAVGIVIPFLALTWSIGVEEQFYLMWPWIIKKNVVSLKLFVTIFLMYLLIKSGIFVLDEQFNNRGTDILMKFWNSFVISSMTIGAVFAYILFEGKSQLIRFIFNKYFQFFVYVLIFVLLLFGIKFPFIHYELYALIFGVIIINLAGNKDASIISLENKPMNYLGKVSYGLYIFHPIAIFLSIKLLTKLDLVSNNILLYFAILLLTVFIASLSYSFYESWFLKSKKKFSTILSGEKSHEI